MIIDIYAIIFLLILFFCLAKVMRCVIFVFAIWIMFVGFLGNAVVVTYNGGQMPVFFDESILHKEQNILHSPRHKIGDTKTQMSILSDRIFLKKYDIIVSIGDVLMFFAIIIPLLRIFKTMVDGKEKIILHGPHPVSYPVAFIAMIVPWGAVFLRYASLP